MKTHALSLSFAVCVGLILSSAVGQLNQNLGPYTYASGQNLTYTATRQIETTGAVVVSADATVNYQAGVRVRLTNGFHAAQNSYFRAVVADTDGDGMGDLWEIAHGLNPLVNDSGADPDSDGLTNLKEYQNETPPNNSDNSATSGTVYYGNPQFFDYTGGVQTFIVPQGVVSVKAKVWGAGGGAGYEFGTFLPKVSGGAGGYSEMEWGVVPGSVLTIVVGEGGQARRQAAVYGGGGASEYWSGSGGGRSEVTAPNGARVVAGGGGGGGTNYTSSAPSGQGGNGGGANQSGATGVNNTNNSALGGAGGTTSAGGAGGLPYASSGGGTSLQGQATPGLTDSPFHGGGGGGGYFGGGAGSSYLNTSSDFRQAAGGGGGSGYATIGLNVAGYQHNNLSDNYWGRFAGSGGRNGAGGNGRVVILLGYASAPATPQITSDSAVQFTRGTSSTYQITATNSPTSYEVMGDPPPGMTVNAGTGQLAGAPLQTGNYQMTLKAINGSGASTRELTVSVISSATEYLVDNFSYSASMSFTTAVGKYDKVTLKAWGGGGGSAYVTYPSIAPRAAGGHGGYGQMDVGLDPAAAENIVMSIGGGGRSSNWAQPGAGGGGGTQIALGGKILVAGGGGGAGNSQYSNAGDVGWGGAGGNGGGANQSGLDGESLPSGANATLAGGGGGGTPSSGGTGGTGNSAGYGDGTGIGQNGTFTHGGVGGSYSQTLGTFTHPPGDGGGGYYGGGGGGLRGINPSGTTYVEGAGGGGGSGYASGGTNVVGYSHNNTSDPDWGSAAGSAGSTPSFVGQAGRAVLKLFTFRPIITSDGTWSVTEGRRAAFSIATGLGATHYALTAGELPPGFKLDARTGVISGTGTSTGRYPFSVVASNDFGTHLAKGLAIQVNSVSANQQYVPFVTGFEPYEGYTASATVANQDDWLVLQGTATVESAATPQGQQVLHLPGGGAAGIARHNFLTAMPSSSIVFVDCLVRLTADTAVGSASRVDASSSSIALFKNGEVGEVRFYQGMGNGQGTWQPTGKSFVLDGNNQTVAWVRLTMRQDYVSKRWDLYVDGNLVGTGIGLGDPGAAAFNYFAIQGHATGPTAIDRLYIAYDNPLFEDADRDGMDDDWERANGLDPTNDDRAADFDGDGLVNLHEFRHGSFANVADSDGDGYTDAHEVTMGTSPAIPANADPNPPGIVLHEPVGATLQP